MPYDVFISYASKDKIAADAVCARLEVAGIRCWIAPRDIVPGTSYGEAITDAIRVAQLMVLVFSSNSNSSAHIPKEVERAVSKGLPVIPFRIEDVAPGASLDYFIGSVHWLDAMTPPLEKHLDDLAASVEKLLTVKLGEKWSPTPSGSGVWQRTAPLPPPAQVSVAASTPEPPAPPPAVVRSVSTGSASSPSSKNTTWIVVAAVLALALIGAAVKIFSGGGSSQTAQTTPTTQTAQTAPAAPAAAPSPAVPSNNSSNSNPIRNAVAATTSSPERSGPDPIVGCYMWFTNGPVVIRPNHTAAGGPFTASWKVVSSESRTYQLLWDQHPIESMVISPDQNSVSGGDQYGVRDSATRMAGSGGLVGIWNWSGLVQALVTVRTDGSFEAGPASGTWSGTWQSAGGSNFRLTASTLPKDTLTLAADGSRLSGTDNYNIAISGVRTEPCSVN